MKFQRIRGTRDILPDEYAVREDLLQRARKILRAYGYRFIQTPTFEPTELFVRSVGETTDIVEKEMYTFQDRGGRSLTLRAEGTAPVIRAFLENQLPSPIKLAYYVPIFRAERPQKGRLREHYQLGVEAIGERAPLLDAEVIRMLLEILQAFGLKEWRLEINSIGSPEDRRRYREALLRYLEPRRQDLCADCQRRMDRNPLRVLDCKVDGPRLTDAPRFQDYLGDESRRFFEELLAILDRWNIAYTVNPRLVRGLDYYTDTVFEVKVPGLGAQDTVAGGGRYDRLVEELGGPPTPAVGFGMGMERVLLALGEPRKEEPLDYFVAYTSEATRDAAVDLVFALRRQGYAVDFSHEFKKLRAQMKRANRLKARKTVIVGDDELARGVVRVRDMETGSEEEVPLHRLQNPETSA